ncbi:hypothetical protein FOIG_02374 [Fusarium odoratissimum NRRL 54006]|uniref:Uncharacterized protein n=2 Tax=Fusarium oxysporum species complex TaxID=171631 RepID=X0KLJ5_FUSO5|nr:uncharacterized protein FOIG_02374 [Fusarium odoratissimum NRRL 54006]EXM09627.1 hypothetical protein FOIG_02374 [Fusarium odoratissimum NRRL 54006]TXC05511.1 hypothetical protein FocTR4_00010253 [Fusarium oxysporum f. sp. cubense]
MFSNHFPQHSEQLHNGLPRREAPDPIRELVELPATHVPRTQSCLTRNECITKNATDTSIISLNPDSSRRISDPPLRPRWPDLPPLLPRTLQCWAEKQAQGVPCRWDQSPS